MATVEEEVLGRTREVDAIVRFVDRLPTEGGSLVIAGEAGIGKTTLWRAGVAAAERRSYRVCRCRPAQTETEMSFAALIDLFEDVPEDAFRSLPGPQRRALEVALLRRDAGERSVDPRAVAAAALRLLKTLAEAAPVTVAVDDVQWLDSASAGVLHFVFRRVQDAPIGVLASVRTASVDAVIEPLSEGPATELRVAPLSLGAIQRLLRSRLDPKLPRPLLNRIHEVSGGNPFFALEITRGLQRRAVVLRADLPLPIPDTLGDLVRERLATLRPESRAALLVAAACSRPTPALANAVIGDGTREALEDAVSMTVIEPVTDAIVFTHPLLASILYADGSPAERRNVHERLAAVVAEPEERARHLGLAAEGPDPAVAAALDDAAHRARARGAASAAAELSLLARDLTPPDQADVAGERSVAAADHYYAAGDTAAARTLLEGALSALAAGPTRAGALHRLATIAYHLSSYDDAERLLMQALDEAGEDDATRARAHGALAWVKVQQGAVDAAGRHASDAVALAERAGDEDVLVEALTIATFTGYLLGDGLDGNFVARALALEEFADHLPAERRPGPLLGLLTAWVGRMEEGRRLLMRVHSRCVESGDEGALPVVLYYLAHIEWHMGLWDDAWKHLDAACALAEDMRSDSLLAFALAVKATLAGARGDIQDARSLLARSVQLAEATATPMAFVYNACAAGALELSVGDHAAAHERLDTMAGMLVSMPTDAGLIARVCGDDAEALIALGKLDRAEELVSGMEERIGVPNREQLGAVAARCRALLSAARGDSDAALVAIEEAMRAHSRIDHPFERARTLLAQGAIERRARRKGPARASLEEAVAIFERLGATPWADKARAELARIGGRAPAPRELTPAEAAVADAVARGLSNKEVAAELFMSVNTVETHLKRIFRKLEVRSRTELAAQRRLSAK